MPAQEPPPEPPAPEPPAPSAVAEAAEEQAGGDADAPGGPADSAVPAGGPAEEPVADATLVPPLPHSCKAGRVLYGLAMKLLFHCFTTCLESVLRACSDSLNSNCGELWCGNPCCLKKCPAARQIAMLIGALHARLCFEARQWQVRIPIEAMKLACFEQQLCIHVATPAHSHCSHRHMGAAPAQAEAIAEPDEAEGAGPPQPAQAEAGAEPGEAQAAGQAPPGGEGSKPVRAALGAAADALRKPSLSARKRLKPGNT